ncbi:hypothetical protein J6590_038004 [Homalodisca vitripennis]|nr:hypothetical protein J6590_038004 [Homalodisca vitripennis]
MFLTRSVVSSPCLVTLSNYGPLLGILLRTVTDSPRPTAHLASSPDCTSLSLTTISCEPYTRHTFIFFLEQRLESDCHRLESWNLESCWSEEIQESQRRRSSNESFSIKKWVKNILRNKMGPYSLSTMGKSQLSGHPHPNFFLTTLLAH